MADEIVVASAPEAGVAIVAGITTQLVREAQQRHELSPTASAAVGRLMTGAALLGTSLKGRERLSIQVAGDGPLGGIVADVMLLPEDTIGVRGYAKHPRVNPPLNDVGKLAVGLAVGAGKMQVTRSYEVGQPYVGVVPLETGEIAEDLAAYLANSQQIPSAVALGVLIGTDGVTAAGGAIGQVLPGADDRAVAELERCANAMPPVTQQISAGARAHDLLDAMAGDIPLRHHRRVNLIFACRCTREKVETALLGLGRDELLKIASEQPETEARCEFCRKTYVLSASDVSGLAQRLEKL
ncbi:MAG: Hsp33 family molecular chaperone HslO [Candidatus Eremiobacteraeota bacterium]|nr:Hsp33 family molecular chaperone HslO [Candidatus Eremiobacteraeota bacterium]